MVVINHGWEDFLPVGLPQSGDVGFEIVQDKPNVADHASPDNALVRPVCSPPGSVGRHVAIRVVVVGYRECGAYWPSKLRSQR